MCHNLTTGLPSRAHQLHLKAKPDLWHICRIFLDLHLSVIFQLQLLTTWGDPYYIGLNGLEFYDQHHEKISLSDNSILCSCICLH